MQRKVIELGVDVPGAVVGIPGIVVSPEFGLVTRHRGEQIGAQGFLGEFLLAVHAPDVVVLVVIEKPVPALADEQTIAEGVEIEMGEYHLEDVLGEGADAAAVHFAAAAAAGCGSAALLAHLVL